MVVHPYFSSSSSSSPITSANVYLLDYGAGNVRSLINAVHYATKVILKTISCADDFSLADILIFPGVGAFGQAMEGLRSKGYITPLLSYLHSGKPFFGICVGLQSLFSTSEESPNVQGLNVIPFPISLFSNSNKVVPHMGWNAATTTSTTTIQLIDPQVHYYFVHSYAAIIPPLSTLPSHIITSLTNITLATTRYGDQLFIAALQFRNIFATQFHPEKSGVAGLRLLRTYLSTVTPCAPLPPTSSISNLTFSCQPSTQLPLSVQDKLTKRIIACLDIRTNDAGQLVVTKGQGYDVRESVPNLTITSNSDSLTTSRGDVRNLGDPITLAERYFNEGADEIDFLNITSFRSVPVKDLPMLDLLRKASTRVFVPITIGGGIRDIIEPNGNLVLALDVVSEYFRAGADKVSIGSDAVFQAEQLWANRTTSTNWPPKSGLSSIEQISAVYGAQAVVVSIDPRRVYVPSPQSTCHHTILTSRLGPNGEKYCWYQCTVKGGREGRDLDVVQLVTAVEYLGAGEILLNCMDTDGSKQGFDLELINLVKNIIKIPVVASSGAGNVQHFAKVFNHTNADAALAAGIFHRNEVPLPSVKEFLVHQGISTRLD